ncbi:MAG: amidase domain-containing protein [Firmicutes bacterium]|nr:amidase domain-containing protein [Bacillota bacterium]
MTGRRWVRGRRGRAGLAALAAVGLALLLRWTLAAGAAPGEDPRAFVEEHFRSRVAALVSLAPDRLPVAEIDTSTPAGRWLAERERQKILHLRDWLRARGFELVDHQAEVRILRVRVQGDTARVAVVLRLGLGYRQAGAPAAPVAWMGVGTSHAVELVRGDGGWRVRSDHGLDPLYEDGPPPEAGLPPLTRSPAVEPPGEAPAAADPPVPAGAGRPGAGGFDREAAARYADTYCGVAWGCGNSHRYNRQYRDYTGMGGDCANFASQVLAAGGLRPTGAWRHDPRRREATATWINAGSLARYLLQSGRGQLVARGSFARVAEAAGGPGLPVLAPGDIIAYEQGGDVVHVSVVVGQGADGYAVVSSHTADRYRVPWDLGWGKKTRFWLIRIRG